MGQTDVEMLNTNFGIAGQLAFRADASGLVTPAFPTRTQKPKLRCKART